ncbi:adenylyltransferase/cytidyltransferase family protein [Luteolibacter ambystomatis]|uniref:Adenylyltransferase/cytidyltransferase family protein n=1 Tax=Luteolibacter ambystomatis TaxID=2824561 RepID=A0A975G7L4_9BACT|nr:adenylyltransferase/cytidyltransferase family protein [Luteolibacter ambystomatis]QUE50246.1 adenylyltransferase/cytidyltransferase family protein [Luteolibacter ambystomatis]
MVKVFVSGCFDVLHAGHLRFFEDARAHGDHLTVSVASAESLWRHKQRKPSIPDDHKQELIGSLRMVDEVVLGEGGELGLDFEQHFRRVQPQVLVINEGDPYHSSKSRLCDETGCRLVVLGKSAAGNGDVSSSSIARLMRAPEEAPLRVDFAGGWLDVPRYAQPGTWIVNMAISPLVSLRSWPYEKNAGLGGSGAWALLNGHDGCQSEIDLGVGWQDPAVIRETGLCIWQSGPRPVLELKTRGEFLNGCMALLWTGKPHDTPGIAALDRDFEAIARAGAIARAAVKLGDLALLAESVRASYRAQLGEGMDALDLPAGALAAKYCGGGHGGYAVVLFSNSTHRDAAVNALPDYRAVEPFCRS